MRNQMVFQRNSREARKIKYRKRLPCLLHKFHIEFPFSYFSADINEVFVTGLCSSLLISVLRYTQGSGSTDSDAPCVASHGMAPLSNFKMFWKTLKG
ncbi:hypothetical protein CEXT_96931 [Caerostris extrusa]|uniref:Uncharacterized protein n=1 Tax=Caerostris extrusa TaxID=172846 RepID=A0AAV4NRW5_CAEEX|nr:hypothetical protein CEXT_96931 [Caerostris extrusa]